MMPKVSGGMQVGIQEAFKASFEQVAWMVATVGQLLRDAESRSMQIEPDHLRMRVNRSRQAGPVPRSHLFRRPDPS